MMISHRVIEAPGKKACSPLSGTNISLTGVEDSLLSTDATRFPNSAPLNPSQTKSCAAKRCFRTPKLSLTRQASAMAMEVLSVSAAWLLSPAFAT